jgi:UDP-N-acetylmuramoylalanine--D-glutamate ligase
VPPSLPERIGLLGLGVEGRATLDALRRWGHAGDVLVLADRLEPAADGLRPTTDAQDLRGLDLLVRSPGFAPHHPLRRAADALGIPQTTATRWFLAEARALGATVVGVTGSKGKSTTTSLLAAFLTQSGHRAHCVGNIGRAALDALPELRPGDIVALELSSYQCDDIETGPDRAVVLGLFPEHMDWHGGYDAYVGAKLRLVRSQPRGAQAWLHPSAAALLGPVACDVARVPDAEGSHFAGGWFRDGTARLWSDASMRLRGLHNRDNAVAAFAASRSIGVTPDHAEAVLARFQGLPHRLTEIGLHGGVRWVDDAISTAPEAIAAALDAIGPEVATLICGGMDRGYDLQPAVAAIERLRVGLVIGLPDTGMALAACVGGVQVDTLAEAVALACERTPPGRTVLFSPGGPSYHRWKNFEARGEEFLRLVRGDS